MSFQYSSSLSHSDDTHLESFVESILSASLPNEVRRNLEHLRDLDKDSSALVEKWRAMQDDCLKGVEESLVAAFRGRIVQVELENAVKKDEGDGNSDGASHAKRKHDEISKQPNQSSSEPNNENASNDSDGSEHDENIAKKKRIDDDSEDPADDEQNNNHRDGSTAHEHDNDNDNSIGNDTQQQQQDSHIFIPTTEEIASSILHHQRHHHTIQKQEIRHLYQQLQQFSSERIKTAHQVQSMVDMALGRLNRDLAVFERELGMVVIPNPNSSGPNSENPNATNTAATLLGGVEAAALLGGHSHLASSTAAALSSTAGLASGLVAVGGGAATSSGLIPTIASSEVAATAGRNASASIIAANTLRRAAHSASLTSTMLPPQIAPMARSGSAIHSNLVGAIMPPPPIILPHNFSTASITSSATTIAATNNNNNKQHHNIKNNVATATILASQPLITPSTPTTNNTPTTKNLAAIQVIPNSPDWILAKIQTHDKSTKMYTLSDEDVESADKMYTLPEKQVVALRNMERNRWTRGDVVYAVYPDTTSFYHATVSQGVRRLTSVGPGGMVVVVTGNAAAGGGGGAAAATTMGAGLYVMVLFQDDGDENGLTHEKAVPVQYVMKVPPGASVV